MTDFRSHMASTLARSVGLGRFPIELVGSTSPTVLAWVLSQQGGVSGEDVERPRLIICPRESSVKALLHDLKALRPDLEKHLVELQAFDESPYSGLYPSLWSVHSRTHFLWRAQNAKRADIFVASIEALLQKTMPLKTFAEYQVRLDAGDEVDVNTLMEQLITAGYTAAPLVEDPGQISRRGDILDVFSPTAKNPIRIEFFGDQIESMREFDIESQRSGEKLTRAHLVPAREIILTDASVALARQKIKEYFDDQGLTKDAREELLAPLDQKIFFHGIDYWLPFFYEKPELPLDAFKTAPVLYWLDEQEVVRAADGMLSGYRDKHRELIKKRTPCVVPTELYSDFEIFHQNASSASVYLKSIHIDDASVDDKETLSFKCYDTSDLSTLVRAARESKKDFFDPAMQKLASWKQNDLACFIHTGTQTQAQRLQYLIESRNGVAQIVPDDSALWPEWIDAQAKNPQLIHIVPRPLTESCRLQEEGVVLIREEEIFGDRVHREARRTKGTLEQRTNTLSFGDLNPGDLIVHNQHGVGVYEGLKKLDVQNVASEFIQLKYKDGDRLYLPVYRVGQIHKYDGPANTSIIDKLGSNSWQRAKVKVRSHLRDLADELLKLYAKRAQSEGFSFSPSDDDFREFEATFPYDETPDQAKAINDVLGDMENKRPMDRLVCGDVGFGKTEVAIRAAYKAVRDKKQVAVLVPTTVLAFQHYQTFKNRFKDTAVNVGIISRFSSSADVKKTLAGSAEGRVDILIGTHRILSKDVLFNDLGLLIVDEEQKFGVAHKERIKKMRTEVDVLTLSATPIPRTLNMGLMGVRDLSLINTPPEDRLSIRTFVSRFDPETLRKAITSEIARGGQVYFIHNRVQSIYGFSDQIREIVPHARIRVAHGQMPDDELEKTMLDFYNHEFDVLLCTTIIESGLDIPRANTIIVDRADTFGLSQLYQLRGRVGRSKDRAYAYLLVPPQGVVDKTAQERLKILQEYTELGSGFHIAHHDLELRGSGSILGENQSGHIATVGYELYMELLEQALAEVKGETIVEDVEPDINLRIAAFIPDQYIEDIRIRLSFYKALSDIRDESDLDQIEHELVDRFGQLPEQVTNLFGVMLIRRHCKDLGIRDISAGPKNLSLAFLGTATKAKPEALVRLATVSHQKYQLTPDGRLIIRLNSMGWMPILEELKHLKKALL